MDFEPDFWRLLSMVNLVAVCLIAMLTFTASIVTLVARVLDNIRFRKMPTMEDCSGPLFGLAFGLLFSWLSYTGLFYLIGSR